MKPGYIDIYEFLNIFVKSTSAVWLMNKMHLGESDTKKIISNEKE